MKDSEFLDYFAEDAFQSDYFNPGRIKRMYEIIDRIKDIEMSVPGFPKE